VALDYYMEKEAIDNDLYCWSILPHVSSRALWQNKTEDSNLSAKREGRCDFLHIIIFLAQ